MGKKKKSGELGTYRQLVEIKADDVTKQAQTDGRKYGLVIQAIIRDIFMGLDGPCLQDIPLFMRQYKMGLNNHGLQAALYDINFMGSDNFKNMCEAIGLERDYVAGEARKLVRHETYPKKDWQPRLEAEFSRYLKIN